MARGLLEGVAGKARRSRARWIVALDELHRNGRSWCTLGEWLETWPSESPYDAEPEELEIAAKAQRARLREALREVGLNLTEQTPDGEGLRINAGTPELRQLVALELETAHAVLEKREPELSPADVVRNYWGFSASLEALGRSRRAHSRLVRAIVVAAHKPIRPRGRPRIEVTRPRDVVERARKAVWSCSTVSAIARILRTTRATARAFRERVLREPPPESP